MMKLLLTNLNISLRSNYYDKTIVDKFNILFKLDYYNIIMICELKNFIKIGLS
jgi:hypothetical protein